MVLIMVPKSILVFHWVGSKAGIGPYKEQFGQILEEFLLTMKILKP